MKEIDIASRYCESAAGVRLGNDRSYKENRRAGDLLLRDIDMHLLGGKDGGAGGERVLFVCVM